MAPSARAAAPESFEALLARARRNPWFEEEVLPALRKSLHAVLAGA